jgi:hypothetical protein
MPMNHLSDAIAEVLETCMERGMRLPFVLCAASRNGTVIGMRIAGPGVMEDLVKPNGDFVLPINVMILDQSGEAVRVVVGDAGEVTWH